MDIFKKEKLNLSQQLSIWHDLIGRAVELNERFNSPFRSSSSMSCTLSEYNGHIVFGSFSEKDKPFNGWTAEKAYIFLRGTDFKHLLSVQKSITQKPKATLVPHIIEWDKKSLMYWYNLGIVPQKHLVAPIDSYLIKKVTYPKLPAFVYLYPNEPKIYCPFEKKDFKWRGLVKKNTTVFVDNKKETILISKSYKDQLTAQSILGKTISYIHVQSETFFFDGNMYDKVIEHKNILLLFDNDETGIKNATSLSLKINAKVLFVPEKKDLSEYYSLVGRYRCFKFLKESLNENTLEK